MANEDDFHTPILGGRCLIVPEKIQIYGWFGTRHPGDDDEDEPLQQLQSSRSSRPGSFVAVSNPQCVSRTGFIASWSCCGGSALIEAQIFPALN